MRNSARLLAAFALLLASAACGGGGKSMTGPTPAAGPGTVTITSTTINNQTGKVVVVAAQDAQSVLTGRACVPITSNAFIVPATVLVEISTSNNPCEESRSTRTFAAGRYNITAGVFVGGSTTPEKLIATTVQVAGNVSVTLDGNGLSR